MTAKELALDDVLYKRQEEQRELISYCIRSCCMGNYGVRETILELISSFVAEKLPDRRDLWNIIPFDKPAGMTAWQLFEAMVFHLDKEKEQGGFERLSKKCQWEKGGMTVTKKELDEAYAALGPVFSQKEEQRILALMIFADTLGLGIIDTLNHQKGYIEEIQIGMSGRTEQQYNYKDTFLKNKEDTMFCREGVHIMVRGCTIWLKALSFETEEELQRVIRNMVKGAEGGEPTKSHPMMVADMPDGRRISVSRPPMTDTWIGLIRKFDTVQDISLEKLYQDYPEAVLLPKLVTQLIRSGRNIAITGEMASGKTTLFRACLAELPKDRNLRIIEADSFELNVRGFLPYMNSVTMRVTEHTPPQDVLAFARKTTGQIFAVGEINSAAMATVAMDLSKIASQLIFSAHYVTTEHMIADFVNAKLCVGGYSEEVLAELDVIRCLGFDIHLGVKGGRRYVQYINEVIGKKSRSYEIRKIYQYDEEKEQGVLINIPSEITYERAKQLLQKEHYVEFVRFFEEQVS